MNKTINDLPEPILEPPPIVHILDDMHIDDTIQGIDEMNIIEFVKKYNGVKVDYDGYYGASCVDLFRQYCTDVLLIPKHTGAVDGAKDLFLRYDNLRMEKKYFHLIADADSGYIPYQIGDILIWDKTELNQYGHTAMLIAVIGSDFVVFEQDGIKQDGAKIAIRNHKNLLGALRYKNSSPL